MPNPDKHNEAELSALLRRAEPPKSPAHVDEAILRYARENAPAPENHSLFSGLANGRLWLNRNWISAAATFSIAVIAVSVTLPVLNPTKEAPDLGDLGTEEFGVERKAVDASSASPTAIQPTPVPLGLDQPAAPAPQALALETQQLRESELATERSRMAAASNQAPQAMREILADSTDARQEQLADTQNPTTTATREIASATADGSAGSNDRIEAEVEEVVVTGAFVARSDLDAAPPVASPNPVNNQTGNQNRNEPIVIEESNKIQFLDLVQGILRGSVLQEQAEPLSSSNVSSTAQALIAVFRSIEESGEASAANERYQTIRENFADFELPQTLESAIALLGGF